MQFKSQTILSNLLYKKTAQTIVFSDLILQKTRQKFKPSHLRI